ncbi:hypothetical protein vseg_020373 [Gypsophila vaccaria]
MKQLRRRDSRVKCSKCTTNSSKGNFRMNPSSFQPSDLFHGHLHVRDPRQAICALYFLITRRTDYRRRKVQPECYISTLHFLLRYVSTSDLAVDIFN